MKNLLKLFMFCFVIIGLSSIQSCKTQEPMKSTTTNIDLSKKLKGTWILRTLDGTDVTSDEGKVSTIVFDLENKAISGNGGCNQYGGSFVLDGTTFTPSPLRSTRMACPQLERESKLLGLLGKESTLSMSNYNLQFIQEGKVVLEFTPMAR